MRQPYHTPDYISDRLGIPLKTLAKWRCKGGGPAFVKFGSRVRYAEDDVLTWLEQNRRPAADARADVC